MASNRKRARRDEVTAGLMGALLGGLNFKLTEHAQRVAMEAEERKEARLAAMRAAEVERAQQFQLKRDEAQNTAAEARLDRQYEQQLEVLGRQEEQQMRVIDRQAEVQASRDHANNAAAAERVRVQASAANGGEPAYQTFIDGEGKVRRIPMTAAGNDTLEKLQQAGVRLNLTEGSRGGRFSAIPGDDDAATAAGVGLMGGGVSGRSGAGSNPYKGFSGAGVPWNPQGQ